LSIRTALPGTADGRSKKTQEQINRRWTPMDADDPNEIFWLELLRAKGNDSKGTDMTIPLTIGVHRRPSAVPMLFRWLHRAKATLQGECE
jgi:hypothetical protein